MTMQHLSFHYIGGEFVAAKRPEQLPVHDSSTEEVIGKIPAGTADEATQAVLAARAAFPAWSALSVEERCVYLDKISAALKARADDMGLLIAREVGMPLKMAKAIQVGGPVFNWANAAKKAREFQWEKQVGNSLVVREPIAVEFPAESNHFESCTGTCRRLHRRAQTQRNRAFERDFAHPNHS
jgi:acyl-CoA reductase-like NAD-dependent aldehyde dehydrogenase